MAYTANQVYFHTMQAAKCELWLKIHEITCVAFSREEKSTPYTLTSWKQLLEHHENLISWYDSLPRILAQNASVSPQNLLFQ